jgi:TonB-linked SusC/RagA family outer membrane protein
MTFMTTTLNQFLLMNQKTIAAGKFFLKSGLILITFLVVAVNQLAAQQKTISGTITDATDNNKPLANVSVVVKGSTRGTTTNAEGRFSIEAAENETLVFSVVGYLLQEVKVAGQQNISLQLRSSDAQLESVVVTALGIRREQKALGYASQVISSDDVNDARSNNFVSALSGKVAGLRLISPGSGPVNSVRVTLRGDNSLNPDGNNALIVLDGVPMNSQGTSSGVGSAYGAGSGNDVPIDFGNGIADINPDDIESITVLKGASATALYGSRAANGALLITTKSGSRKTKGIGVTLNSNASYNTIIKWPDYQYEWGQGTGRNFNSNGDLYYTYGASADGASTSGTSSAFGPKFEGQSYFQYDPNVEGRGAERTPWKPYTDNIKGFWRTGFTLVNSVSLEGGSDKTTARASLTHTKNEWIMPNTGFERITAALSVSSQVSENLKVNAKVNFTNKKSDNLPATGYNNQSISYFMIFQNPNVDLAWYRPIWKKGKVDVDQVHPFSSFIDNPYLIAYEMTNSMNNYTTVANLSGTYTFSKKFELLVRTAVNHSSEERAQRRPYSTANFMRGYYREQDVQFFEINTDGLFTYKDNITRDIKITASAGANTMRRKARLVNGTVDGLVIPGVYKLSNGASVPVHQTGHARKVVNSLYGFTAFSWKDKIFLDLTGRNDWSSTLPVQNNSFFYSSASSSFILNELIMLPTAISFAKLRLSIAQVGNDTDPYKTSKYYGTSEFAGSGSVPTLLHNVDFKPEITTSYEAGLDFKMFQGRIGFDLTGYRNITRNQILEVPLDPTTGYSRAVLNGGKVRNQGVELVMTGSPVSNKDFKWNTTITWSRNWNRVMELAEGMDGQQPIGSGGNASIIAKVGGTTGAIYGFGFMRSPDGQIIYNATTGLPLRPADIQYIGEAYADWKGGIMNEFSYKNFRFSFLLDGQYGGLVYSQTHHKMTEQGKLKHTLKGREDGYIVGPGVVDDGGVFKQNTKQVNLADYYADVWRRANVESNSFDASYLKLREARIEYTLPKKLISKLRLQNATFAIYGRDLLMITSFPMFDPETAALNGSTILPGVEIGQMPSARTIGANLTLKF